MLPSWLLLSTSLLAPAVHAWNTDVHNQIGLAAETFLTPTTTAILQRILEPAYNGSIGQAAAWADAYAHTPEGAFSYPWHWIDSADEPPASCSLDFDRDCPPRNGCVVQAIANQTSILRGCVARAVAGELVDGSDLPCSYALKWVAHFLGDITQPLHASGRAAGGNFFRVMFGNHSTELHAVWDGYIIYSAADVTNFSTKTLSPFFDTLVSRIKADAFAVPTAEWLSCSDPSTPIDCAMSWARESNVWTCEYVYEGLVPHADLLASGYAEGAYPIVELQVSKAALRLGTWLNRLVESALGLDGHFVLQTGAQLGSANL